MAVFYVAGWLPHRGKAQMACNYCFPTRTMFSINSEFWRKGMFRWENLTSHLVRTKNSSYYIAPVGDWTHDLPHTVASNMVKVSHVNHSAGRMGGRGREGGARAKLGNQLVILYETYVLIIFASYITVTHKNNLKCCMLSSYQTRCQQRVSIIFDNSVWHVLSKNRQYNGICRSLQLLPWKFWQIGLCS